MGVFGSEPWIIAGGARLRGEKNWPVWRFLKSGNPCPAATEDTVGASRVGVIGVKGVTPLVAVVPKNWAPNIPGDMGIPCAGKMNLVMSFRELWVMCCCACWTAAACCC